MNKFDTIRNKMPFRRSLLWITLLFLLGLAIAAYPLISKWYYRVESTQQVDAFEKGRQEMPSQEILARLELAKAYNETLDPRRLLDPFTERQKEGVAEYARMLEIHEQIGHVRIPRINQDIPIYAGTSEAVLQKGAGHMEGTSLPVGGSSTHTVITAHRGLPNAHLFTDLDQLQLGDKFYIHYIGGTLAYRVDHIEVVEPTAIDRVMVVEDKDYCTLLTCTPYMINSHRLLVRGERIDYVEAVEEAEIRANQASRLYRYLFLGSLVALGTVLLGLGYQRAKKNRMEGRDD